LRFYLNNTGKFAATAGSSNGNPAEAAKAAGSMIPCADGHETLAAA